jgi:hypothetical protein
MLAYVCQVIARQSKLLEQQALFFTETKATLSTLQERRRIDTKDIHELTEERDAVVAQRNAREQECVEFEAQGR